MADTLPEKTAADRRKTRTLSEDDVRAIAEQTAKILEANAANRFVEAVEQVAADRFTNYVGRGIIALALRGVGYLLVFLAGYGLTHGWSWWPFGGK